MPYFEFERLLTDDFSTVKKVIEGLKRGGGPIEAALRAEKETFELKPFHGTIGIDTWAEYQTLASEVYFKAQPQWTAKKQSGLAWGEVKDALARQIHQLSAFCHLLIVTAHVRQAFDDGEPIPQLKEAKLYNRVWQTLDLVGYLVKVEHQAPPKAILAPPYGKTRLPAMPEELPSFSWEEVFKYAVTELELPTPHERRGRMEQFLEKFRVMVHESGQPGDGRRRMRDTEAKGTNVSLAGKPTAQCLTAQEKGRQRESGSEYSLSMVSRTIVVDFLSGSVCQLIALPQALIALQIGQ